MNSTHHTLTATEQATQWAHSLPAPFDKIAYDLTVELLHSKGPLHLVLVGAFSVGKSSLVNTLIGEKLLPSAREETTALPTFIEHGEKRQFSLAQSNGHMFPLAEADLLGTLTTAPAGASHAVVALPLPWLNGINIIDLPGLGTVNASHSAYTHAQIMEADAVLYLMANRGPSQEDMKQLQLIRQLGKRVKVVVTHWDIVQAAIERGEKSPSLEKWAQDIELLTGLRTRLTPIDHHGLGRDEVIQFFMRAQQEQSDIRWQRYKSELRPLLENALGQLSQARGALAQESEEAIRTIHQQLLDRKQALQTERSQIDQQQRHAREELEATSQHHRQQCHKALQGQLNTLFAQLQDAEQWSDFQQQAQQALHTQLTTLAQCLNQATAHMGTAKIEPGQIEAFNLRLAQPEAVPIEQFLQQANIVHLQQELQTHEQEITSLQQRLNQTPMADLAPYEQGIKTLIEQRSELVGTPLPQIVVPAQGSAAFMGRMLGEAADLALIFINPSVVAAKAASISAKVGKVAKITVNANKVATTVRKGMQVTQTLKQGGGIAEPLKPLADKFGLLEMLSLSYWGEKIGAAIDGSPTTQDDPEALAERDRALAEIQKQERELRRQLNLQQDIANERQLTGDALLVNQQAQQRLKEQIAEREQHAQSLHDQHEAMLIRQQQEHLQRLAQRIQERSLGKFDSQAATMQNMALENLKSYWECQVKDLLDERLQDVQKLQIQLNQKPEERAVQIQRIEADQQALHAVIQELKA